MTTKTTGKKKHPSKKKILNKKRQKKKKLGNVGTENYVSYLGNPPNSQGPWKGEGGCFGKLIPRLQTQ